MFLNYETVKYGYKTTGVERRLVWEVVTLAIASFRPVLEITIAAWEVFARCEFKKVRQNWQRRMLIFHVLATAVILGVQGG